MWGTNLSFCQPSLLVSITPNTNAARKVLKFLYRNLVYDGSIPKTRINFPNAEKIDDVVKHT